MKNKLSFISIFTLCIALLLTACGVKQASTTDSKNTQTEAVSEASGKSDSRLDDLYQQENQLFADHADVWNKAFGMMNKSDADPNGNYADYLAGTVESNKNSFTDDGLEFVRWMRCSQNTYIICLTALDQEMDQIMGYEAGADDYITKPFSLSVLLLKIEAHFRRRQEKTEAGKMISGDIVFIAGEMKVLIKSREISLTKTELKMLTFFLQNPKQILSKTQILENVFDLEGDFVDENTIAVNIRRLREKIEDNPAAPVYIKNIRGLGYIWNQEVRQ